MKGCVVVLFLLALAGTVHSWAWYVHMIIYIIARNEIVPQKSDKELKELAKSPEAIENKIRLQGIKILEYFDKFFKEGKFADGASKSHKSVLSLPLGIGGWADHAKIKIKENSNDIYPPESHYYAQTYNKDKSPMKLLNPKYNVFVALNNAHDGLTSSATSPERKAHMLALLIHMMGDMHQPLHMITRCESKSKICDGGASKLPIEGFKKARTLHELWDTAMLKYLEQNSGHPAASYYTKIAGEIANEYKRDFFPDKARLGEYKPHAEYMFKIGREEAYDRIEIEKKHTKSSYKAEKFSKMKKEYGKKSRAEIERKGSAELSSIGFGPVAVKLSQGYIDNGFRVCKELIALAGYRLADALKQIYFKNNLGEKPINP